MLRMLSFRNSLFFIAFCLLVACAGLPVPAASRQAGATDQSTLTHLLNAHAFAFQRYTSYDARDGHCLFYQQGQLLLDTQNLPDELGLTTCLNPRIAGPYAVFMTQSANHAGQWRLALLDLRQPQQVPLIWPVRPTGSYEDPYPLWQNGQLWIISKSEGTGISIDAYNPDKGWSLDALDFIGGFRVIKDNQPLEVSIPVASDDGYLYFQQDKGDASVIARVALADIPRNATIADLPSEVISPPVMKNAYYPQTIPTRDLASFWYGKILATSKIGDSPYDQLFVIDPHSKAVTQLTLTGDLADNSDPAVLRVDGNRMDILFSSDAGGDYDLYVVSVTAENGKLTTTVPLPLPEYNTSLKELGVAVGVE